MKTRLRLTVGLLLLRITDLTAATLYVSPGNMNPTAPYASWSTAATNIQDAVNGAVAGDLLLITNGVYAGGLRVSKPLRLLSANGSQFTTIDGSGTNRCVYLTNDTSLSGFTLTNGFADYGGGVSCGYTNTYLTNCVIVGNRAISAAGVDGGTLYNCLLWGNSNVGNAVGGGATYSTLYNCTVTGNSAGQAGGVYLCRLYNCIVYDNIAQSDANYNSVQQLNYCCTTPLPGYGVGNLTNAPLFVSKADGDFRLQAVSPCIDAGNSAYVSGATDLDGNPRISGSRVDMGAYELQFSGVPLISLQPLSQTVYAGSNLTFTVGAAGSLPLSWQWWFKGAAIRDATNASLALPTVTANQAGGYSVVITNSVGSITSQVAVLTVNDTAPAIISQPIGETVIAGTNVTFSVGALGSLPLSPQWNFNGRALRDATNLNLTLPAVTTKDFDRNYLFKSEVGVRSSIRRGTHRDTVSIHASAPW